MYKSTITCSIFLLILGIGVACKKQSVEGPLSSNVERVALLLDYEYGYGGAIYPVYNPYVFFKDGTVVKEPKMPIEELDLNALSNDQAGNWGTWTRQGDKVAITYANGKDATKDWPGNEAYPALAGDKQQGTFGTLSGGGNLAWGGDVGVLDYSKMSFTSDGWYTTESIKSGNTSTHTAYHTATTAGRYSFDGDYSITLTANNGQKKRYFFCWYSKDGDRAFRLGGRTFSKKSE